jgi:hypothetical protein
MKCSFRNCCKSLVIVSLVLSVVASQTLLAQGQQVTATELRQAVKQGAFVKQDNLNQVRSFFSDPKITKILANAHLDSVRIEKAMSTLSASELATLAARTAQIQGDFAAGTLSNQDLTYIVIALGAAVLVLILV